VAAYWRKLARSVGAAYSGRGRAFAKRAARALHPRRDGSRRNAATKGIPARQAAH
jgi:hypothetical protein